ncbi:hypothetical protein [Flavobacterium hercynium]|nr:hypothetical protein [Flavobacterium hercynium]SMP20310.1 hypothetical protein SAMN06265346_106150 [Flavobacterium hercynium]
MEKVKEGKIVKFHSPQANENPDQLYVVLEVIEDAERSKAKIQALNTGLSFPPVNTVKLADLKTVKIDPNELIGHKVTIIKSDDSRAEGRVIKVSEQKIDLDLSLAVKGVQTNVLLTVVDNDGAEHLGMLFIDQE